MVLGRHALIAFVVLGLNLGCQLRSPFVPRESFVPEVNNFAKMNAELANATAPKLNSLRTDLRTRALGVYVTQWIDRKRINSDLVKAGNPVEDDFSFYTTSLFLCRPRQSYTRAQTRQGYLLAASTEMTKVAATPVDNIPDLAKALTQSYEISVIDLVEDKPYALRCEEDLNSFVNTVYPTVLIPPQYENAIAAAGAIIEFVKIAYAVLEPTIRAGLQEVDSARRANALRRFLKDPAEQTKVQGAIQQQGEILEQAALEARHWKVKEFNDHYNAWRQSTVMATTFSKTPSCQTFLSDPARTIEIKQDGVVTNVLNRFNPAFQICYKEVMTAVLPFAESMLVSAGAYDHEADKVPPDIAAKLLAIHSKLRQIADGEIDERLAQELLNTAMRMGQIAQNTAKAFNEKENKEKITKALDDIQKAFNSK